MAKTVEGLVIWQLAHALRVTTFQLTRSPRVAREFALRNEVVKTLSSICRNIPEGFRRGTNREFARFVEYSYSSCGELRSLFDDLEAVGAATRTELRAARTLQCRLDRALQAFMRHLRRYPDRGRPDPARRPKKRRQGPRR